MLGDFFKIVHSNTLLPDPLIQGVTLYKAAVELNASHRIFEGHFPGNPVVPGVTLIEMVKEILEQLTNSPLVLKSTGNVKFLFVVNPLQNPLLDFVFQVKDFEDLSLQVKCTISTTESVVLKFDGIFSRGDS